MRLRLIINKIIIKNLKGLDIMNYKIKNDFKNTLRRILGRYYNLVGIILILSGVTLRLLSIGKTGFAWIAIGDLGTFLAIAFAIPFIYDRLIKTEERELFLNDLEEVLEAKLQDIHNRNFGLKLYDSRRNIDGKVVFFQNAKNEVIEIGISLRTFSGYFEQRPSKDFKDHILELLQRGVVFKCFAMDPNCKIAIKYAEDTGDDELLNRIQTSLKNLKAISGELRECGVPGKFEIYVYSHIPYFHAVCVDGDEDHGQIFISPYLFATKKAETPGFEFSKNEHPVIFEKYWKSVKGLMDNSKKL